MQKSVDLFAEQLHGISAIGSSSLIETVKVDYYGQQTPLQHLASFESQGLRVTVKAFDRTVLANIAKACQGSGFNAYVFSKESVVVQLPDHSGDTRNEMKARIAKLGEDAKIAIRNCRKQFRNGLPKENTEEAAIQKLTDQMVGKIDDIVKTKSSYISGK